MGKVQLSNPFVPLNSLILVTGANGLIASHIADQLLEAGYRVRGTVRSKSRNDWVEPLFDSRHGPGRFELVEVADLATPGIWDDKLDGVAGVISVAGSANIMVTDVDAAVEEDKVAYFNLMAAAKKQSSVQAFILTSSAWAVWSPRAGVAKTVTEETWNEEAIAIAADPKLTPEERGIAPFQAVKAKAEQACWEWIEKEKPSYTFNTMLLDTVLGPILNAKNQSASTAGMVRWLWNSENLPILQSIEPQWYIDARDTGRLYLAVMASGKTGQRVFGCAERFSWEKILEILKGLYPDKTDFPSLPEAGWDQTELPMERARAYLRDIGQEAWTPLVASVQATAESFV